MRKTTTSSSLFRSAGSIFTIKVLPALAILGVMLYYSRALPQRQYGEYQNVWVRLALMGTLAYAGLPAFFLSYSAAEIKGLLQQSGRRLRLGLLVWVLLWCGIYAALQWTRSEVPLLLSAALSLLYVVNAVQESLIIAARRSAGIMVATAVYTLVYLFLHYRAIGQGYDLQRLLYGLALLGLLRSLWYAFVIRKAYRGIAGVVPEDTRKNTVLFWGHSGLYDLLQTVFRWADKFIISLFLSEQISAVYFNGALDIPFVSLLLGAFSSSVLVRIAHAKENDQRSVALMQQMGRLLACLVFPLFFFLFLYRAELFLLAFGEAYRASVPVFAMTLLLLPLRAYGFGTLLQSRRQGRIINTGAVLDLLVAFALMYPLYRLMGLPGAALSFVISTVLQCLYYLYHTGRLYSTSMLQLLPLGNWAFKLIIFGVLFIGICYATRGHLDPFIHLSLGAALALISAVVSFMTELKRSAEPDEQQITSKK